MTSLVYVLDVGQIKPRPSNVRGCVHDSSLDEIELSWPSGDHADDDYCRGSKVMKKVRFFCGSCESK